MGYNAMARWLPETLNWLDRQSQKIPTLKDVEGYADFLPVGGDALRTGVQAVGMLGAPIGAAAGVLGARDSEAGREGADLDYGAHLKEGAKVGGEALKEAVNVLDVASLGAGGVAGAAAKAAPKVAKIAGLTDLGISAADAALGAGNVGAGIQEGDLAKTAMGAARVAGNAFGGVKAKQDLDLLDQLGVKRTEEFETPHWKPTNADGRKTQARFVSDEGNEVLIRSGEDHKGIARNIVSDPKATRALSSMADWVHTIEKHIDEDGLAEFASRSGLTNFVDDLAPERIATERRKFAGYNLGGEEYGSAFIGDPQKPFFLNPVNIAKRTARDMDFLLTKAVDPVLLEKALSDVPPDVRIYAEGVRAGEPQIPELQKKLETQLFLRNMLYTTLHESTAHWQKGAVHRAGSPMYKDVVSSLDGGVFEMFPKRVSLDDPMRRGMNAFEPSHNTAVTAIIDDARLVKLKEQMASPEFIAQASKWYDAVRGDYGGVVAKRSDRVMGRAEANRALAEFDEPAVPPTPPGSVPPAAPAGGGGRPTESLANRIKASVTEHQRASNINKMKRAEVNNRRAELLKANEEKLLGQKISAEEAMLERKKIMSGSYDLINEVDPLQINSIELNEMARKIASQSNDDAFLRERGQLAFEKMVNGERLEDNEIQLMRELMRDRTEALKADPMYVQLGRFFRNATGGARTLMTAYDVSAAGRQGLYGSVMNPREAASAFKAQIQALGMTRPEFDSFMLRLQDPTINPYAEVSKAAGLHFSDTAPSAKTTEEVFAHGKWAEKLPGVKRTEQAYIAYLNKLRVELFNKHVRVLEQAGEPLFDAEMGVSQKVKDLAYMVNTLTGRGEMSLFHMSPNSKLGKKLQLDQEWAPGKSSMDKAHEALTTGFFAPRFTASRFALFRDTIQAMVGGGLDPQISRIYMKNVLGTVSAMSAVVGGLAAMGVGEFQPDPRKKDFGVLKVGNTRYDVFGGLKPIAKIQAVLASDQYWSGKSGIPKKYGDGPMNKTKRGEVGRFVQTKLSPLAGFIVEAVTGEDFMGRKSKLWENAYGHTVPMIAQTIVDLYREDEMDQLLVAAPASLVGIGVNTYSDKRFNQRNR